MAPQPRPTPPYSLVFRWGSRVDRLCVTPLHNILMHSRWPSTRTCYQTIWRRFTAWVHRHRYPLDSISIPIPLDYLLHLRLSGLTHSSVCIHLAVLSAFLPLVDNFSVFTHLTTTLLLHDLRNAFPSVWKPLPSWDLNLILSALNKPPFKPFVT